MKMQHKTKDIFLIKQKKMCKINVEVQYGMIFHPVPNGALLFFDLKNKSKSILDKSNTYCAYIIESI